MRYREIVAPTSHPHNVKISIDPADLRRLERLIEDARELHLLDVDDRTPDRWSVRVGCASERVRERFEDGWG